MNSVERLINRQLSTDFSMLEIGVGSYPFSPQPTVLELDFMLPNPHFDFRGNRKYLGVDNGTAADNHPYRGTLQQVKNMAESDLAAYAMRMKEERPGENIAFRFGDILGLKLPLEAYDEVTMTNVLSSMIGFKQVKALVARSLQLLKPSGTLVTRETFTPWYMRAEDLPIHLRNVGFREIDIFTHAFNPEDYDHLRDYYGATLFDRDFAPPRDDRYFCLAIK